MASATAASLSGVEALVNKIEKGNAKATSPSGVKALITPTVESAEVSEASITDTKMMTTYDASKARLAATVELCVVKFEGGLVYIKATVGDTVVYLKAKLSSIRDSAVVRSLEASTVKILECIVCIRGRVGEVLLRIKSNCDLAFANVVKTCASVQDVVRGCVDTATLKFMETYCSARLRIAIVVEPYTLKVRDGFAYASGRVGDMLMYVKAQGDQAKGKAFETYASMQAMIGGFVNPIVINIAEKYGSVKVRVKGSLDSFSVKVQDGLLYLKGKIGDTWVYIVVQVSSIASRVWDVLEPYYVSLKGGYMHLAGRVGGAIVYFEASASDAYGNAKTRAVAVANYAKISAHKIGDDIKTIVVDEKFRTTMGAATGGAVALGASGGATGLVTGGVFGAAVGIVPAFFTLGLSIPIGAAIGSGAGLCVGMATGGAVGLVSGGAAGYGIQAHKEGIGSGASKALTKATACKDYVASTAISSKSYVKAKLNGATGGSF